MIVNGIQEIPTCENGVWRTTTFESRDAFKDFVLSLFKEPGKYEFDETSRLFNKEAKVFNETKDYCTAPFNTRDYVNYWDAQKERCRAGAIYISTKTDPITNVTVSKTWYLSREYYMWLNFLPIMNKETGKFGFADVRDAQYHISLYVLLAELHYMHAAIVKKRQIAASYYFCAKLLNQIWFEEGVVLKMGASLKAYVLNNWGFLNEYKDFLNKHTAWKRDFTPGAPLDWKQLDKFKRQGRWVESGLKGTMKGLSFEKSDTSGVGGLTTIFFYDEAGIAPTMNITAEFLFPSLRSGQITTGLFIASGSVGDLEECEPLKQMVDRPQGKDIYAVPCSLIDETGKTELKGLFIPEQWSMLPFIDEYGNSLIEESDKAIFEERKNWERDLDPKSYQIRISQHPRTLEEAFGYKEDSKFPLHLVGAQEKRILDKEYALEYLDLKRDKDGKVFAEKSNRIPISEFPISPKLLDKRSVLVVHERPMKNPEWGIYFGSIDPVTKGSTTTSESLCSIYIYKRDVEVRRDDGDSVEIFVEPGKLVAFWCGRYDNLTETNELLRMIIEWYNAFTIIENNVQSFINYMISVKKQHFLAKKSDMVFAKDLVTSQSSKNMDYGWPNTGRIFYDVLVNYLIEFLNEVVDEVKGPDGKIYRTVYGIERIPDIMAMKEMKAYKETLNVDRLVALAALIAFVRVQVSNITVKRRIEKTNAQSGKEKSIKLVPSMFKNIGQQPNSNNFNVMRNPYKNLK